MIGIGHIFFFLSLLRIPCINSHLFFYRREVKYPRLTNLVIRMSNIEVYGAAKRYSDDFIHSTLNEQAYQSDKRNGSIQYLNER